MRERVYFEVEKADGQTEKMEILAKFKLDKYNKTYLLYCDLKRSHYYAASCLDEEYTDLETNLTDEEKNDLNKVFLALGGK